LDRQQAMALLKELVAENLIVDPTHIAICLSTPDNYQIQIKEELNLNKLIEFAQRNDLAIEEVKEEKYVRIYKQ